MSEARIIDGRRIARRIRGDVAHRAGVLKSDGHVPRLDAILVGNFPAGQLYARSQQRRCEEVGIDYNLHALSDETDDQRLQAHIEQLNTDPAVTGIMLNLPLPDRLDAPAAQYLIDPYKDIEGVNPANIGLLFYDTPILAPCTALAVLAVLRHQRIALRGARVAVIGQGNIVGKPIALALMTRQATVLTCNKFTDNLADITRTADVLISAAGVAGLVQPDHVKPGATVIDVGINRPSDDRVQPVVGDVCFESVRHVAGAITPVPGGVGPVTVALLLSNTVESAAKQLEKRRFHR